MVVAKDDNCEDVTKSLLIQPMYKKQIYICRILCSIIRFPENFGYIFSVVGLLMSEEWEFLIKIFPAGAGHGPASDYTLHLHPIYNFSWKECALQRS